jgi:hypothetical protein
LQNSPPRVTVYDASRFTAKRLQRNSDGAREE